MCELKCVSRPSTNSSTFPRRLLYLASIVPCLEYLCKAAVRAKRRWDSRKSAFEMEVERIREQYGIDRSSSEEDTRVRHRPLAERVAGVTERY